MQRAPPVELIVLGAGPAYSDRHGAAGAAYLVRTATTSVVLDLGQGAFPALARTIEPSAVDAVVISHLHPDHFVDLVPLRHYLRYEFQPPRRVAVHAPAGLAARIDALHAQPGFTAATLEVVDLEPGGRRIGDIDLEIARVTHTGDSHGFRLSTGDGPGLVYSGDCGVASDLGVLVREGDTLLVEISFGAGPVPAGALHLDGPAIAAFTLESRPGRVLLTHLQMGFDRRAAISSVRERFPGTVELVEPGYSTRI